MTVDEASRLVVVHWRDPRVSSPAFQAWWGDPRELVRLLVYEGRGPELDRLLGHGAGYATYTAQAREVALVHALETGRLVGLRRRSVLAAALSLSDASSSEAGGPSTEPPARDESPTWFEVQVIDEVGDPVDGLEVELSIAGAGQTLTTDSQGVARLDIESGSRATARIASVAAATAKLEPRWQEGGRVESLPEVDARLVVESAAGLSASVRAERRAILALVPPPKVARFARAELPSSAAIAATAPGWVDDHGVLPALQAAIARAVEVSETELGLAGRGALSDDAFLASCQALATGESDTWVDDYLDRAAETELQVMLAWVARSAGLPCDPGTIDGIVGPKTQLALRRFKLAYPAALGLPSTTPDFEVRRDDVVAMYRFLRVALAQALGVSEAELDGLTSGLAWLSPPRHLWGATDPIVGGGRAGLDALAIDAAVVRRVGASRMESELQEVGAFSWTPLAGGLSTQEHDLRTAHVLDVEDVHFNNDRHIVMPDGPTPEAGFAGEGITGLRVIASALAHARQHPSRRMLVAGHTDWTGRVEHNLRLSKWRAENAWFLLKGFDHKEAWVSAALRDDDNANDWRRILRFLDRELAIGCEASDPEHPDYAQDVAAIRAFQKHYNDEVARLAEDNPRAPGFEESIPGSQQGFVGLSTWRAFFDYYQHLLRDMLELPDASALLEVQGAVLTLPPETVGCGEFHAVDLEERDRRRAGGYADESGEPRPEDRRVEVLFFDEGEAPPMDCHSSTDAQSCDPMRCHLYDHHFFVHRRIPMLGERPNVGIAITGVDVRRPDQAFEPGRVFCPRFDEEVRFHVALSELPAPFEGSLRLVVARRTVDGPQPVATLEEPFESASADAEVLVVWDGRCTDDAPRARSDRTATDVNEGGDVNIPLREMEAGDPARHGGYFVSRVAVLEKDGTTAGAAEPAGGSIVVSFPISPRIRKTDLVPHMVAFGLEKSRGEPGDYVTAVRRGVLRGLARFYSPFGIRFREPGEAEVGYRARIVPVLEGVPVMQGLTRSREEGPGFVVKGANIFGWIEDVQSTKGKVVEVEVNPRAVLQHNSDERPDVQNALAAVFRPTGLRPGTTVTAAKGTPDPPDPRVVGEGGAVSGRVEAVDEDHTEVVVSASGRLSVVTLDPTRVPPARANAIGRALDAFTVMTTNFLVHEVGHALGLVGKPDPEVAHIDVDGVPTLSPLNGADGAHNDPPAGTLMDDGEDMDMASVLAGPLPLGSTNRRYLREVYPLS